jgi:spore coat protein CotF
LYFIYLLKTRNNQKFTKRKFFNSNPKSKALKDVDKIDLDLSVKEFYDQIIEILRKYFYNNFYIISYEMTSMELKNFFKDNELNMLLDEIDQVKFAKKSPSKSEKKDILELLKKVIRKLL